ncbi:MAG: c-type cytochrome biogenesis protein CcmI [Robiginitomaculum sp.]|nr:MAG: c-type cytochrome biogenesis protein CcmI [Robiginitomaculum sp.]
MLWIVLALFLIAAILLLAAPFYRPVQNDTEPQMQVLRDALQQIDRDFETSKITQEEAETQRRVTAQRILTLQELGTQDAGPNRTDRQIFMALAAFVILGTFGLYALLGTPQLIAQGPNVIAAQPAVPTPSGDTQTLNAAIPKLVDHVSRNPDDAEGWRMLGWSTFRVGRYEQAKAAYETALELEPQNPATLSAMGETLFMLADQIVTEPALAAFSRSYQLDPQDVRARFYMGLAAEQSGEPEQALAMWLEMLQSEQQDATWRDGLLAQARELATKYDLPMPNDLRSGPNPEQLEAAAQLDPAERQAMIVAMVERLESRLLANPADASGWQQLIRSRMVLGQATEAKVALTKAKAALADQPEKLAELEAFATAQGVAE